MAPGKDTACKRNGQYVDNLLKQISELFQKESYKKVIALCDTGITRIKGFDHDDAKRCIKLVAALSDLYNYAGKAHERLGEFSKAMVFHEKRYKVASEHDLREVKASSCNQLIGVCISMGKPEAAFKYWEQRVECAADETEENKLRFRLSRLYLKHKNEAKALEHAEQALKLAEKKKEEEDIVKTLVLFGEVLARQGRITESRKTFSRALDCAEMNGASMHEKTKQQIRRIEKSLSGVYGANWAPIGEGSGSEIEINVVDPDDNNEQSSSIMNKVPIPIDDDDSFMPPSVLEDSEGGVITYQSHFDPRNRADSDTSQTFWQLREKDALTKPDIRSFRRPD